MRWAFIVLALACVALAACQSSAPKWRMYRLGPTHMEKS